MCINGEEEESQIIHMEAVFLIKEEVGPLVAAVVHETSAIKEEEEPSTAAGGSWEEAEEVSMEGVGVNGMEGEVISNLSSQDVVFLRIYVTKMPRVSCPSHC
jgi:hypothetical protein